MESTLSDRESGSLELGAVSSVGERLLHTQDVGGSNPSPPTNPTTWIGDICEAIAVAEFMALGYAVSKPLSNGLPYDLIVDDGRRLMRVQVKSGALRDGAIVGRMCSSKYHRNQRSAVHYGASVDWIVVVARELRRVFVVRPDEAQHSVMLRLDPSKNNQSRGVRWAADYELSVALGPAQSLRR